MGTAHAAVIRRPLTYSGIRTTRRILVGSILLGLILGGMSLFIGASIPGMVVSATGWVLVIGGFVWLVVSHRQRMSANSRADSWRPGDESASS
jgi:hypothetical protein